MLSNIKKITFKSDFFSPDASMDLFDNDSVNGCIVYGRNGSGKSTLAKVFRKLSGEDLEAVSDVFAFDGFDKLIELSDKDKSCIHVFDEDYVDKNVKFKDENLETIVMLGEAVQLSDEIESVTESCEVLKCNIEMQKERVDEYKDKRNNKSPDYHLNQVKLALKNEGNWADRGRIIKGTKNNLDVNAGVIERIASNHPEKTKSELLSDYDELSRRLKLAKSGTNGIKETVPKIPEDYKLIKDELVIHHLAEKIDFPKLTEREKRIFTLLEQRGADYLLEIKSYFGDNRVDSCPYCMQPLTSEYKQSILEGIENVLNDRIKVHKQKLSDLKIYRMDFDLSPFEKLEEFHSCILLIEKINIAIDHYNEGLIAKSNNPYEPIVLENENIELLIGNLEEALLNLESQRLEYNKKAKDITQIQNSLDAINDGIAYYEIEQLYSNYKGQQNELKLEEERLNQYKAEFTKKNSELLSLESRRRNVKIAVDKINLCLKYIFFSDKRLQVCCDNDSYKILSNEKNVKPSDISEGERNAIGLSYFFVSMFKNRTEELTYNDENLIVIDDPISSYDFENQIGVLSFLKWKFSLFLDGNVKTRIVLLTHDFKTFYEVKKIFEHLAKKLEKKDSKTFNIKELKNRCLTNFDAKKRNEYSTLLSIMYQYAIGQADDYEIVIGNIMRQVLEAFSTFEYKKGVDNIVSVLKGMSPPINREYVDYFSNLMYRLVLHGGSHREDQVKSMDDMDFFSCISVEEKKRTAKDILCLIYLLNRVHLLHHFDNNENVKTKLEEWYGSIGKLFVQP